MTDDHTLGIYCIPMRLCCEGCGELHIDEGEFATKPHHTHSCQHCGLTWRPAVGPTVGVQFLPGFKNEPPGSSANFTADPRGEQRWGGKTSEGLGSQASGVPTTTESPHRWPPPLPKGIVFYQGLPTRGFHVGDIWIPKSGAGSTVTIIGYESGSICPVVGKTEDGKEMMFSEAPFRQKYEWSGRVPTLGPEVKFQVGDWVRGDFGPSGPILRVERVPTLKAETGAFAVAVNPYYGCISLNGDHSAWSPHNLIAWVPKHDGTEHVTFRLNGAPITGPVTEVFKGGPGEPVYRISGGGAGHLVGLSQLEPTEPPPSTMPPHLTHIAACEDLLHEAKTYLDPTCDDLIKRIEALLANAEQGIRS